MNTTQMMKRALRPQEAALTLSTSLRTLARWRAHGEGPTWFKQGRNVYYPTREIEAWLHRRSQF